MLTVPAYRDACPRCAPGDPPASPARGPALDVNGVTVTDHQCGLCGTTWTTEWVAGWAASRTAIPDRGAEAA
jgi:hypothetical protein